MNTNKKDISIESKISKFLGTLGIVLSFFLFPPIFFRVLSLGDIRGNELSFSWSFFILVFLVSLCFIFFKKKISTALIFIFFILQFFIGIELVSRVIILNFSSKENLVKMDNLSKYTYPETINYASHPFLGFTGKPGSHPLLGFTEKRNNDSLQFNKLGFIGENIPYQKNKNTIRIACLGGSTTMDGYPAKMQKIITERLHSDSLKIEVLNFGLPHWTSAHGAINFLLNVIDFAPDYVIIHDGWNDGVVRDPKGEFRNDYSHFFKKFDDPVIADRYLLRISLLYRYFKSKYFPEPDWMSIGNSVMKQEMINREIKLNNLEELKPFERNIRAITDLALAKGMKVVLSTQPHSLKSSNPLGKHIDQCNDLLRRVKKSYGSKVLWVDADSLMTGRFEKVFLDLGHMKEIGVIYKALLFSGVIIKDINKNDSFNYADIHQKEVVAAQKDNIANNGEWYNAIKTNLNLQ